MHPKGIELSLLIVAVDTGEIPTGPTRRVWALDKVFTVSAAAAHCVNEEGVLHVPDPTDKEHVPVSSGMLQNLTSVEQIHGCEMLQLAVAKPSE